MNAIRPIEGPRFEENLIVEPVQNSFLQKISKVVQQVFAAIGDFFSRLFSCFYPKEQAGNELPMPVEDEPQPIQVEDEPQPPAEANYPLNLPEAIAEFTWHAEEGNVDGFEDDMNDLLERGRNGLNDPSIQFKELSQGRLIMGQKYLAALYFLESAYMDQPDPRKQQYSLDLSIRSNLEQPGFGGFVRDLSRSLGEKGLGEFVQILGHIRDLDEQLYKKMEQMKSLKHQAKKGLFALKDRIIDAPATSLGIGSAMLGFFMGSPIGWGVAAGVAVVKNREAIQGAVRSAFCCKRPAINAVDEGRDGIPAAAIEPQFLAPAHEADVGGGEEVPLPQYQPAPFHLLQPELQQQQGEVPAAN